MAYEVRPFMVADGLRFRPPGDERAMVEVMSQWDEAKWRETVGDSLAWTLLEDGEIICFGGVRKEWEGRATSWFCRGENLRGSQMVKIHRFVKKTLDGLMRSGAFRRIECVVRSDFEEGHRWALMLGFRPEGLLQSFSPLGEDMMIYARINNG